MGCMHWIGTSSMLIVVISSGIRVSETTVVNIECDRKGESFSEDIVSVICPPDCSTTSSSKLWGTEIYSGDSHICAAAIHDGKIEKAGGQVTLRQLPSTSQYIGSTRNGITSKTWDRWYSSSFDFIGSHEITKITSTAIEAKGESNTASTKTAEQSSQVYTSEGSNVSDSQGNISSHERNSYIAVVVLLVILLSTAGLIIVFGHMKWKKKYNELKLSFNSHVCEQDQESSDLPIKEQNHKNNTYSELDATENEPEMKKNILYGQTAEIKDNIIYNQDV